MQLSPQICIICSPVAKADVYSAHPSPRQEIIPFHHCVLSLLGSRRWGAGADGSCPTEVSATKVLRTTGVASGSNRSGGVERRGQGRPELPEKQQQTDPGPRTHPQLQPPPPKDPDTTSSPRIEHPHTSNPMALFPQCGEL